MTAQESVIDGLKMERKIWGQELAQQGKITSFFFFHFAGKNGGVQSHTFQINAPI